MRGGEGAEVYYPLRSNGELARDILTELGREGQIMRGTFQRRLPEDPSRDYYYIHRLTPNTTSLLIEYGFIDNPADVRKLETNLLNYAEAVVRAVTNYANVPYSPPNGTSNNGKVYIVQSGDTLWSIARRFNTTVNDLISANQLTSNILLIGQTLKIPTLPNEGETTYIVQSGDTLWSIANRYGTTINAIILANNLVNDRLLIGQRLIIPGTSIPDNEMTQDFTYYTVQPNDSLWKIANQYGVNVQELINFNNLASTILQIGQQLMIPIANQGIEKTHIVQPNDSLWKIANQYGVNVQDLINFNNLTSNVIQIGQVLRIPN